MTFCARHSIRKEGKTEKSTRNLTPILSLLSTVLGIIIVLNKYSVGQKHITVACMEKDIQVIIFITTLLTLYFVYLQS